MVVMISSRPVVSFRGKRAAIATAPNRRMLAGWFNATE